LTPEEQTRLEQYKIFPIQGGEPKTDQKGWLDKITYGLNFAARGTQATTASVLDQLREATKDVPTTRDGGTRVAGIPVRAAAERVDPWEVLKQGVSTGWEAAKKGEGVVDLSDKLKQASAPYEQQATEELRAKLLTPDMTARARAGKANAALQQLAEQDKTGWVSPLQEPFKPLQPNLVGDEGADAFSSMVRRRGGELAEEEDLATWALEHPNLAQTAHELVLDPLNVVGALGLPGKAAKGISKVAGKGANLATEAIRALPGGEKFLEGAAKNIEGIQALADNYRYMPQVTRMEKTAQEAGVSSIPEGASMLRMAEAEAMTGTRDFAQKYEDLLRRLKAPNKPYQQEELNVYLRSKEDVDVVRQTVPRRLRDAYDAGDELRELALKFQRGDPEASSAALRKGAGMQRWNDEGAEWTVELAGVRRGYVPDMIPLSGERKKSGLDGWFGRSKLQTSSSRAKKSDEVYKPNPAEQWEAWGKENIPKMRHTLQMRLMDDVARNKGLFAEVAVSDDALETKGRLDRAIKNFNDATGLEWVELDQSKVLTPEIPEQLGDVYKRVTGQPGETRLGSIQIVPKEYKQTLDAIRPFIAPSDVEKAQQGLAEGINSLLGTYMRPWRFFNTVPNLGFLVRNPIGGFGLGTIALGLRSLNPELQAKAATAGFLAAAGNKSALAGAREIAWTTRNGTKTTLGDIIDIAHRIGITSQLEHNLVSPLVDTGIGGRAFKAIEAASEFGNVRGIRHLSPGMMAKGAENYQHLLAFMGFLDDLRPESVAKALDLTSKFSGNYTRLGIKERGLLRNMVGFYAWSRFIFPHMMQQLVENPHRMAAWVKARGGIERYWSQNAVYGQAGAPAYPMGAVPGPAGAQPQNFVGELGSHEQAVAHWESPIGMGLSLIPPLEKALGISFGNERFAELLGPLANLMFEVVTGRDSETGGELPPLIDVSSLPSFAASQLGQLAWAPIKRPSEAFYSLYDLYRQAGNPHESIDLSLRYAVGQRWLGLDNWAARTMGKEGLSIGGMFDPRTGGVPGMFMYRHDPATAARRRSSEAARSIGLSEHMLKSLPDWMFSEEGEN
jgi:hypothetical protein